MRWLLGLLLGLMLASCAARSLTLQQTQYQAAKARNARYYTPKVFKH